MIEKLEMQDTWGESLEKLNKVIDAVNELQSAKDVMFNRIDRLNDAMCNMRNTSKNATISKIENVEPPKNVPGPIKLYVCADGSVYGNLDVAKSHAASIFNSLPAGATTTDRAYLERELNRTRKVLGIAVRAIETIKYSKKSDAINLRHKANKALIEIYKIKDQPALEQKE